MFRIDHLEKFQFVINVSYVLRFVIKIINDKIFFWSINWQQNLVERFLETILRRFCCIGETEGR